MYSSMISHVFKCKIKNSVVSANEVPLVMRGTRRQTSRVITQKLPKDSTSHKKHSLDLSSLLTMT